jgi:hypothetical protein
MRASTYCGIKGLVTLQGPLPQSLQNMVRGNQPWSALDIKRKRVWPPQASQALDWASSAGLQPCIADAYLPNHCVKQKKFIGRTMSDRKFKASDLFLGAFIFVTL